MRYQVHAPHTVAYMDFDGQTDDGLYQERHICQGIVEADTEADATALVRHRISREYIGCFRLTIHNVELDPITEQEGK
jgi:hypothetical protein